MHADVKISMLRLFSDCIELTDTKSDGWTVHEWLKRTYALESVPISQNSITWLLRCAPTEQYIELNSQTMWCGLQHAVRTLLCHMRRSRFLDRILTLSNCEYKVTCQKRIDAIGILLTFRVCGRELLPMTISAGSLCQMSGFDWLHDDLSHREYLQAVPTMYAAWCSRVLDSTENLESYIRLELENYQQQLGFTRALFLDALSYQNTTGKNDDVRLKSSTCTSCGDNYRSLPSALVSPVRIAVAECIKTNHRFGCVCQKADSLHAASRSAEPPEYTGTCWLGGNDETIDPATDEIFYDAEPYLFSEDILAHHDSTCNMFAEVALLLYRAHGRTWMGDYAVDELLCAPCLLLREQYRDKDGLITDFPPKPLRFDGLRFKS
jgi:hypothetical protein